MIESGIKSTVIPSADAYLSALTFMATCSVIPATTIQQMQ